MSGRTQVPQEPQGAAPAEAPWLAAQRAQLLAQRGHAWLLQGPAGLGQWELGLALVRSIAARHGGSVVCEGRPDGAAGACFVLRLPTTN